MTVQNWTQGEDAAITVANPTLYIAREENGNTVFENANGRQSLVIEGLTGVAYREILEGYNDAPTFVGADTALDDFTAAEQQGGDDYSVDLNALFSDPEGDALTLTSDNLPAGFEIVEGVLGLDGSAVAHGDHTITVTATDTSGASVSTDLSFSAALNLSSNDQFNQQDVVLDGTEIADWVEYTASGAFTRGSLDLDLKGGDDVFRAGGGLFGRVGTVDIDTGAGNDTVDLAFRVAYSNAMFALQTGSGDDTVTMGDEAAFRDGVMLVETDTGADTITFGRAAAVGGGSLTVNAGADDDTITFGEFAAINGTLDVNAGQGADAISFASFGTGAQLEQAGAVTIDLGADTDRDVLIFKNLGNVTVQNWTQGEDAAIIVDDPNLYSAREENGNTIFESTDTLQSLVIEGLTGLAVTDVFDFG